MKASHFWTVVTKDTSDLLGRFLRALEGTGVPVPHMRLLTDDDSVIGTWFYVMDKIGRAHV